MTDSLDCPRRSLAARAALAAAALCLALGAPTARAADLDGDGVADAGDNCLVIANAAQRDADADGVGDACECGDVTGDGLVSSVDARLIQRCAVGAIPCAGLCDVTGDGVCNSLDARVVQRATVGQVPETSLTCAEKVEGTPVALPTLGDVVCAGPLDASSCDVTIAPGVVLRAQRSQISVEDDPETPGAELLRLVGDLVVPTPEGVIPLVDADFEVRPGQGPGAADDLRGSSRLPDLNAGFLDGEYSDNGEFSDIGLALGADLDFEIPLRADRYYFYFELSAATEIEIAHVNVGSVLPSTERRVIFDPVDPFFYTGMDVASLPMIKPGGTPGLISLGVGSGFSLSGEIPFVPDTTSGLQEDLIHFEGHLVSYSSSPFLPPLPVRWTGYTVIDLDPDDNGLASLTTGILGDATNDVRIGVNGGFDFEFSLPFWTFEKEGVDASAAIELRSPNGSTQYRAFVAATLEPEPGLFEMASRGFAVEADSRSTLAAMFSNIPGESFVRFETDMTIDPAEAAARLNVPLNAIGTSTSFIEFNDDGAVLGGVTTASAIYDGVQFTDTSRLTLLLPPIADAELRIETESRVGTSELEQTLMILSPELISMSGLYRTPRYTFSMFGEVSDAGVRLGGSRTVPIPYEHEVVDDLLPLLARIAEQEAVVAGLQAGLDSAEDWLETTRATLAGATAALREAEDAFDPLKEELDEINAAIAGWEAVDCGCDDCPKWNVVCLGACGACETEKFAAIKWYQGRRLIVKPQYDTARAALLFAQGVAGTATATFNSAQQAVAIAAGKLDAAAVGLIALEAQRESLPKVSGVVDSVVTLELTETAMTGTISGSFQGRALGAGRVDTEATPPVACFVAPGSGEEFCSPL